jgi:hypothetical protein
MDSNLGLYVGLVKAYNWWADSSPRVHPRPQNPRPLTRSVPRHSGQPLRSSPRRSPTLSAAGYRVAPLRRHVRVDLSLSSLFPAGLARLPARQLVQESRAGAGFAVSFVMGSRAYGLDSPHGWVGVFLRRMPPSMMRPCF